MTAVVTEPTALALSPQPHNSEVCSRVQLDEDPVYSALPERDLSSGDVGSTCTSLRVYDPVRLRSAKSAQSILTGSTYNGGAASTSAAAMSVKLIDVNGAALSWGCRSI